MAARSVKYFSHANPLFARDSLSTLCAQIVEPSTKILREGTTRERENLFSRENKPHISAAFSPLTRSNKTFFAVLVLSARPSQSRSLLHLLGALSAYLTLTLLDHRTYFQSVGRQRGKEGEGNRGMKKRA